MTKDPNVFPHDDKYMIYNEELGQYVLTEEAAERLGVNLSNRLRQRGAVNAEIAARNTLEQVSMMIYQYLHSQVFDENYQDYVIAKCPSARPVIQKALEQQLLYFLQVGNLLRSTDVNKRKLAIDENAKMILNRKIPELGHALTYCGEWVQRRGWLDV